VSGASVGIGQLVASSDPSLVISALGLGSCIGLVLADPRARVAGLVHVMLPDSTTARSDGPPGKYADTAVPALLSEVSRLGADRGRLVATIAGGAQMFGAGAGGGVLRIGERNTEAVETALRAAGLRPRGRDVGGALGRTLRVEVATGAVTVRAIGGEATPL
jgi:chemotaxis protein CheD